MDVNAKCRVCNKKAKFMCSSCTTQQIFYCSEVCQTDDWKEHKNVCRGVNRQIYPDTTHEQQENTVNLDQQPQSSSVQGRENISVLIKKKRKKLFEKFSKNNNRSSTVSEVNGASEEEELSEEERIEDLKFYMIQVYEIIKPVLICIILSIFWVKSANPVSEYYIFRADEIPPINGNGTVGNGTTGGGDIPAGGGSGQLPSSGEISVSLKTALIVLAQIIGATFLILFLFKYGFIRILKGLIGLIALALLGYFGFTLWIVLLVTYNLPIDYITFFFLLWNFTCVGLIQIFWKGPQILNQGYLVLMSSLMAFSLSTYDPLTSWILLSLLAVWDLIAVLCPFGPLKLLIESSRDQEVEIPALLYSTMVWIMAFEENTNGYSKKSNKHVIQIQQPPKAVVENSQGTSIQQQLGSEIEEDDAVSSNVGSIAPLNQVNNKIVGNGVYVTGNVNPSTENNHLEMEDEEVERSGLKLGLGDFVFYSVLVARSALFDWTTTIATTIGVMTGMNMTIFLLAIYGKALPALPISNLIKNEENN
ncbi:Presenilin-1 [Lobulomyces angularis]|nr:Presenilin-1 [Lobulomyces angularis]